MRLVVTIGVLFAAVLACFLPQLPAWLETYCSKSGTVVDAETGNPMSDVAIVATAWFEARPVGMGQSSNSSIYRYVARSNSDGSFRVPSLWRAIVVGIPGSNPLTTWSVTAVEPGYVTPGDEKSLQFNEIGRPSFNPRSQFARGAPTWSGLHLNLKPLLLRKANLSLKQAASYYSTLFYRASRFELLESEPARLSREKILGYLVSRVCDEKNEMVDVSTAEGVLVFYNDWRIPMRRLEKIEPINYKYQDIQKETIPAASVCASMLDARDGI